MRGRRAIAVLRRHLGQLPVLPHLQNEIGPGIDYAGEADHERPHDKQDAGQIVDVEPAHDARAVAAIGAEIQLPHRRRIDDDAGYDGDTEEYPHQSKEQLARQTGKHVGVQPEHDVGEAPGNVGRIEIGAGMRIHPDKTILRGVGSDGLADAHEHRVGIVAIPNQEVRHLPGRRSPRHWRAAGRDRRRAYRGEHRRALPRCAGGRRSRRWKISGRPVMHNRSMKSVQIRLVHLWTKPHLRIDRVAAVN